MLETIWFILLTGLFIGYAVLDGFDLGTGALHLAAARSRDERARFFEAIGPVWHGNEVWLLAAAGAMFAAFPSLYAASFSGFYLALMVVVWLLILRGLAIELRHQFDNPLWQDAWDVVFAGSSLLLASLFGIAFANVLRGVPLDAAGEFQGSFAVLLNPFALLGGLLGAVVLGQHGAAWLAYKTHGALRDRLRRWQRRLWAAAGLVLAAVFAASFVVRPGFGANFLAAPLLFVFPAAGLGCYAALPALIGRHDRRAFLASAGLVAALVASAAAGLYPRLLPALAGSPHPGLDIHNTAAPAGSLRIALGVFSIGMAFVAVYLRRVYRIWRGRVRIY